MQNETNKKKITAPEAIGALVGGLVFGVYPMMSSDSSSDARTIGIIVTAIAAATLVYMAFYNAVHNTIPAAGIKNTTGPTAVFLTQAQQQPREKDGAPTKGF